MGHLVEFIARPSCFSELLTGPGRPSSWGTRGDPRYLLGEMPSTLTVMWLHLEAGTARALQWDSGVSFAVPPAPHPDGMGWHALVIVAAETYFPEAGIEDLPMWAAAEVARGLTGPLRTQIAATRPDDPALPTLRDNVLKALGATPDHLGAMSVVDRVYADRLLRGQVPPVITASCLAWYGNWRDGAAGAEITEEAMRLADAWAAHPDQRSAVDARIVGLATRISGRPHSVPLEERPV